LDKRKECVGLNQASNIPSCTIIDRPQKPFVFVISLENPAAAVSQSWIFVQILGFDEACGEERRTAISRTWIEEF
jgi:hypothetical protein